MTLSITCKSHNIKGVFDQGSEKTKNLSKHLASLKGSRFRSILAFPIYVKGDNIGTLALLKELPDGFNKEMTKDRFDFFEPGRNLDREFQADGRSLAERALQGRVEDRQDGAEEFAANAAGTRSTILKLPRSQNPPMKSEATIMIPCGLTKISFQ